MSRAPGKLSTIGQSVTRLSTDQLDSDSHLVHSGPSLRLCLVLLLHRPSDRDRDRASVEKLPC